VISRWTVWEDSDAGALQLSLAILDANWEPLYEVTKPCGPFHDVEERRLELHDDARRWLAAVGIQERLDVP